MGLIEVLQRQLHGHCVVWGSASVPVLVWHLRENLLQDKTVTSDCMMKSVISATQLGLD